MEAVDVRGRFVWHQLMTRDVPGAKNFYSKLVGWKTMPWPLDPAYTVCQADAGPVAGIMAMPADLPADVPSHWVQYIATRDVDGTADAAVRAGGSVMKTPSDMQGAGRYALLKDPQGALFAIIDPENARPEPQGPPPLGTFAWHELATTDHEAAFAFYSGLFGWDVMQRMDMGSAGVYLIFGQNGAQRGGMYNPSSVQMPPSWMPYVQVPNADSAHQLATSGGASSLVGPMDVPGGSRIACLLDPAGAAFSVVSTPAATSAESAAAKSSPASRPKAKPKAKAKVKAKAKAKAKMKAGKKPVARKKVPAKAARKSTRKVAKRARRAAPRKKAAARKKSGARRKK
jgi:predicted enzyme related to lactoylglutathione lyase